MKEAIAIVCAPTDNPCFGYFALTATGVSEVAACQLGGFHVHEAVAVLSDVCVVDASVQGTYGTATHVQLDSSLSVAVTDLRNSVAPMQVEASLSVRSPRRRKRSSAQLVNTTSTDPVSSKKPRKSAVVYSTRPLGQAVNTGVSMLERDPEPDD